MSRTAKTRPLNRPVLDFTRVAGGVCVRCPRCCATSVAAALLVHADGCAVRRQIETAVFLFGIVDADPDEPTARHG